MELWWWIEPLTITGLILAPLAAMVVFINKDSESIIPVIIGLLLLLPLFIAGLSAVVWFICSVFYCIWSPYF